MKIKLVFEPWLGLFPFSVVEDELQESRLARLSLVQSFADGQRKITSEKKIWKLLKMAPLILVLCANERNGLSCFDEILQPRIVSSY